MNVTIGGSFAVDGLQAPLQRMLRRTGMAVQVSWLPYGMLLPPPSSTQAVALVRVEDYMVKHPELLSKLASASSAAKAISKTVRIAELEAKRAAKKRHRAAGMAPQAAVAEPNDDDDSAAAAPPMPSVADVLTAATSAPSWEAAVPLVHSAVGALVAALLHTQGGDTAAAARSLDRHIPSVVERASTPWTWFRPPTPGG